MPFPCSLVPQFQTESKCENDFDLHENEIVCRIHFHMKGFTARFHLSFPRFSLVTCISRLEFLLVHCFAYSNFGLAYLD